MVISLHLLSLDFLQKHIFGQAAIIPWSYIAWSLQEREFGHNFENLKEERLFSITLINSSKLRLFVCYQAFEAWNCDESENETNKCHTLMDDKPTLGDMVKLVQSCSIAKPVSFLADASLSFPLASGLSMKNSFGESDSST